MRYLTNYILNDLKKKMVFVGGPRQCGKTTLAKSLNAHFKSGQYYNWDDDRDRKKILNYGWSDNEDFLIFDEIHKFPRWKNFIKGVFDKEHHLHHILVTGSSRLDVYRRGGDSLLGRYHYWRLHPFTLSEIPEKISLPEAFQRLMTVGGFPEPFLDNNENEARRWRQLRRNLIVKEDLRDLENIRQIQNISLLVDLLRSRVGSLIVLTNLAQDLQVSPTTVKHWIEILEKMYLIFTVKPYTGKLARALQKPFKVYFYDNADVDGDEGAVFENLAATHLLKKLNFLQDSTGIQYELMFIRDREKREVDFIITKERKPDELIEVKWSDKEISPHLIYFAEKLKVQFCTQIVAKLTPKNSWDKGKLSLTSPLTYFKTLAAR